MNTYLFSFAQHYYVICCYSEYIFITSHVSYTQFTLVFFFVLVSGIAAVAEVTVELALHHLALSCDELTLSVCGMSEGGGLSLTFYDVRTFMNKVTHLVSLPNAPVFEAHIMSFQVPVGAVQQTYGADIFVDI